MSSAVRHEPAATGFAGGAGTLMAGLVPISGFLSLPHRPVWSRMRRA